MPAGDHQGIGYDPAPVPRWGPDEESVPFAGLEGTKALVGVRDDRLVLADADHPTEALLVLDHAHTRALIMLLTAGLARLEPPA